MGIKLFFVNCLSTQKLKRPLKTNFHTNDKDNLPSITLKIKQLKHTSR